LREEQKLVPVNVTEPEVAAAFHRDSAQIGPKPATVTFRQVVIAPRAGEKAREAVRVKAESLLAEIRRGGDFAQIAKRESMDPTKDVGGDLGWIRRGDQPAQVERFLFGPYQLQAETPSPVIETPFDFEIVRLDRIQAGEVRVRAIKLVPKIDSADVA